MAIVENKDYVMEGLKLIYPERREEWENAVRRANPVDIKTTLQIMKELSRVMTNADIMSVAGKYNGKLSGDVLAMVLGFSKKGPEFLIAYDPAYYDENAERKFIDSIIRKNSEFASFENMRKQPSSN